MDRSDPQRLTGFIKTGMEMRSILLAAAGAVALMIPAGNAQAQGFGTRVVVDGCVTKGVEPGCLIVHERSSTFTYNISAAKPKPDPANKFAVHVTGVVSDRVSFCMQGPVLEKITLAYTKTKCEGK